MSNLNSGELSTGTWYHLAGVHSGTDLKLYIDGSNTNVTNAITGGTLYDSAAEFSVGFPWGAPIDGIIDEVRLSSEARSESWLATETNNLSNQGTGSGKFIKTVDSQEDNNPPTSLYRSVGNSATALASGSGNALTISDSTASFGSGLSDSIGVGDAIQYDSDGNDSIDAIAFIHSRTDSQTYTVKDKTGATPTAVTGDNDWSIYRAFDSLSNWEAGDENDLIHANVEQFNDGSDLTAATGNNTIMMVACYADGTGAMDDSLTIDGWTTGPKQLY